MVIGYILNNKKWSRKIKKGQFGTITYSLVSPECGTTMSKNRAISHFYFQNEVNFDPNFIQRCGICNKG